MDHEQLFYTWARPDSVWTRWAKPAIFTVIPKYAAAVATIQLLDPVTWRAGLGTTAAVINLPGAESVNYGLSLAEEGYQPVPLFNSIDGPAEVYNTSIIKSALEAGGEILRAVSIPPAAPPAFLIDSTRLDGDPSSDRFDNRWVVFPQDFPSSTFLQAHGIQRVILVQNKSEIDRDLGQVLAFWKRSGLEILLMSKALEPPHPLNNLEPLQRFSLFRAAFAAGLLWHFSLRRSDVGAFGSELPTALHGG